MLFLLLCMGIYRSSRTQVCWFMSGFHTVSCISQNHKNQFSVFRKACPGGKYRHHYWWHFRDSHPQALEPPRHVTVNNSQPWFLLSAFLLPPWCMILNASTFLCCWLVCCSMANIPSLIYFKCWNCVFIRWPWENPGHLLIQKTKQYAKIYSVYVMWFTSHVALESCGCLNLRCLISKIIVMTSISFLRLVWDSDDFYYLGNFVSHEAVLSSGKAFQGAGSQHRCQGRKASFFLVSQALFH